MQLSSVQDQRDSKMLQCQLKGYYSLLKLDNMDIMEWNPDQSIVICVFVIWLLLQNIPNACCYQGNSPINSLVVMVVVVSCFLYLSTAGSWATCAPP